MNEFEVLPVINPIFVNKVWIFNISIFKRIFLLIQTLKIKTAQLLAIDLDNSISNKSNKLDLCNLHNKNYIWYIIYAIFNSMG